MMKFAVSLDLTRGALDILNERMRQWRKEGEGFAESHDDMHTDGELASAAAAYALPEPAFRLRKNDEGHTVAVPRIWPWSPEWWKPKSRRQNLVRAGALILAEIDRLDRAEERAKAGR